MITQDIVKGVDLTGVSTISATQINQIVDTARPGADKGFCLWTEDTADETPDVPDPDTAISGITPTWWKRYTWNRKLYADGTGGNKTYSYVWNEDATSDATYLKWQRVDQDALDLAADVAQALSDSADALSAANTAVGLVTDLQTSVTTLESDLGAAQGTIQANTDRIDLLENAGSAFMAGDLRWSAKNTSYSTSSNEGWLRCDGSAVSRTIFATLFNAIGTTCGSGDGSTTFNIPDVAGRTLYGAGAGSGLTSRSAGTKIGAEEVTLTPSNIGKLEIEIGKDVGQAVTGARQSIERLSINGTDFGDDSTNASYVTGPVDIYTKDQTSFNNVSPGFVAYCYIKT